MSNLFIKKDMKAIQMPIFSNQYVLCKHTIGNKTVKVIMMPIDDEIEQKLDKIGDGIRIKNDVHNYYIQAKNILLYGELDFNNEDDIKVIKRFNFLSHLLGTGIPIPEYYDYNKHVAYTKIDRVMLGETWNPVELCQLAHGSLNKPKKIILFKHYDD